MAMSRTNGGLSMKELDTKTLLLLNVFVNFVCLSFYFKVTRGGMKGLLIGIGWFLLFIGIIGKLASVMAVFLRRMVDLALCARPPTNSSGKSTDQGSNLSVRLMTVKEVAKALRICTATVYGVIERRDLSLASSSQSRSECGVRRHQGARSCSLERAHRA